MGDKPHDEHQAPQRFTDPQDPRRIDEQNRSDRRQAQCGLVPQAPVVPYGNGGEDRESGHVGRARGRADRPTGTRR